MHTIRYSLILLLSAAGLPCSQAAHPAHSSLTEIEWNGQSQSFEVAMKLSIPDLEDAISAEDQKRFRIREDETTERRISQYLRKHFTVTSSPAAALKHRWIGMELELHEAWFYFELQTANGLKTHDATVKNWEQLFDKPSPRWNPENVIIRHSALCEIQPEQTNIVSYKANGRQTSLTFNIKQLQAPVRFEPAKRGWTRPAKAVAP